MTTKLVAGFTQVLLGTSEQTAGATTVRDYSRVQAPALAVSYETERSEDIFFGRDLSDEWVAVVQRITYGGLAAFAAGMQRGTVVALRDGQHNLHLVSPDALDTIMRRWLDRRER